MLAYHRHVLYTQAPTARHKIVHFTGRRTSDSAGLDDIHLESWKSALLLQHCTKKKTLQTTPGKHRHHLPHPTTAPRSPRITNPSITFPAHLRAHSRPSLHNLNLPHPHALHRYRALFTATSTIKSTTKNSIINVTATNAQHTSSFLRFALRSSR